MKGRIHSIETMGLTDGPGIRFVVFFQGCKLRCSYCHNPDTWDIRGGKEVSPKELLARALRFKSYFDKSGGGITCSGGEPLLQPEFLIDFLKLCKENGLHTAIDTAGFGKGHYKEILKYTDLVILDIKHINEKGLKDLTGGNYKEFLQFAEIVKERKKPIWFRHVVVPEVTDEEAHLIEVKEFLSNFNNVERFELLPYHTLGVKKYDSLGLKYKLNNTKPMCSDRFSELERIMDIA